MFHEERIVSNVIQFKNQHGQWREYSQQEFSTMLMNSRNEVSQLRSQCHITVITKDNIVVTEDSVGNCIRVTKQDKEGKVTEVIWEQRENNGNNKTDVISTSE
jgi:6-phosphogluconolactonase (cycloisomerase 2 family)